MALPWIMIAAMAAQAIDRNKKQQEAKRQSAAGIQADFASQMGAPTYGYQAASGRRKSENEEEGEDYLKDLMPLLNMGGGKGGGHGGMMGGG